jgi:hypothetical protein
MKEDASASRLRLPRLRQRELHELRELIVRAHSAPAVQVQDSGKRFEHGIEWAEIPYEYLLVIARKVGA